MIRRGSGGSFRGRQDELWICPYALPAKCNTFECCIRWVSPSTCRYQVPNLTRISQSESCLKSDPIVNFARAKPQIARRRLSLASVPCLCPFPSTPSIHPTSPQHPTSKAYIVWPYPIYDASSPLLEHPSKNEPSLEKPFFDSSSF